MTMMHAKLNKRDWIYFESEAFDVCVTRRMYRSKSKICMEWSVVVKLMGSSFEFVYCIVRLAMYVARIGGVILSALLLVHFLVLTSQWNVLVHSEVRGKSILEFRYQQISIESTILCRTIATTVLLLTTLATVEFRSHFVD